MNVLRFLERASASDLAKVYSVVYAMCFFGGSVLVGFDPEIMKGVFVRTAPFALAVYVFHVILFRIMNGAGRPQNKFLRMLDRSGEANRWDLAKAMGITLSIWILLYAPFFTSWREVGFVIGFCLVPAVIFVVLHPKIKRMVTGR